MVDPNEDGISHINVYSKGKTNLGRFLSNFADCNVLTDDGMFRTIEGYWYWLSCRDERLRQTEGWESKKLGRQLRCPDWNKDPEFEGKIARAILTKMMQPWCLEQLHRSGTRPFMHYYVYGTKVVMVKEGLWMMTLMNDFRDDLLSQIR